VIAAAAAPVNAYLLLLLAAAARGRRSPPPLPPPGPHLRFALVVPARDEERSIAATLASLRALEYPPDRVQIIVIADRCVDRTAAIAAAAGAEVWRRSGHGGKGAVLAWALARLDRDVDAVVIVDADCTVAPGLLAAVERRLRDGAVAVQTAYGVANPGASPVAALRHASFALVNGVRPLGKSALGLSAGLFGTGMAFRRELLERMPWTAESLVEDQEHHLSLVAAGVRVVFAPEAGVVSAMPTSLRRSSGQQLRWDAGRAALIRTWTPRLFADGLRRRSAVQVHAALEPLVPPQSLLLALNLAGCVRSRRLGIANLAGQATFVLGGLAVMRAPAPVWRALAFAPVLAAFKLGLLARLWLGRGPTEWVRTEREPQAPARRPRMRRSWSRRTWARSSGSARGARRAAAASHPAR
jgi:1,2-diacylglycerol 3-beta-glucosyltransferase